MKKKSKIIMILSIIFISIIYFQTVGVKPANATCIDVTKDPCFSGMFDVPSGMDSVEFYSWAAVYMNQTDVQLNYLRTLNLMIDTCNIIGEKIFKLTCTSPYKGFDAWDACVYIKYVEKQVTTPFGFTKQVIVGDTIKITDIDPNNKDLIDELIALNTNFCNTKLVLLYYNLQNDIKLGLIFENHIQTLELINYLNVMGYKDYESPTIFSPLTSVVNNNYNKKYNLIQQNDELIISTDLVFENTEIEIYDLLGICQIRTEINNTTKMIDISNLPRGVYFVKVGNQVTKFMRE